MGIHTEVIVDTQEEATEVRRKHNKFIKGKAAEAKAEREKGLRMYSAAVMGGKTEDEAKAEIMERLSLTPRRADNIIARRGELMSPKAQALSEARVLVHLDKLEGDITTIRNYYDDQLDKLDAGEDDGDEWFEIEEVETIGGKEDGKIVTKKLPISEARLKLLERKANALDRFFTAVKALRGNQVLVNIQTGGAVDDLTHQDLRRQIVELEEKHRISGGVSGKKEES